MRVFVVVSFFSFLELLVIFSDVTFSRWDYFGFSFTTLNRKGLHGMGNEMGNGIVLFSNAAILFFIGDDETV